MSDDVTASVQKVLDDFHLKNEHVSKLTSVYDDLDSLVQLIHRGQNFITLNSNDREELNQSDKVQIIYIQKKAISRLILKTQLNRLMKWTKI